MAKKKILIVDDEKDVLILLEKRLSKAGYEVAQAANGRDALTLAKSEKPDLIVLDVMMPDMGGEEVAANLKNDAGTKDIPVIFLTCLFTKKEEVAKSHQIGDNLFFAKPYNPEELLAEIKNRLNTQTNK